MGVVFYSKAVNKNKIKMKTPNIVNSLVYIFKNYPHMIFF